MKKILVPTDFSECATAATHVAMAIAKKTGAEIYFLHLHSNYSGVAHVPSTEYPRKFPNERHPEIGLAKAALEKVVSEAKAAGINAIQEFVINDGEERLEEYIRPFEIDLVVMGSNGARGLKEIFIGSNTERLIWNSPVPVLVIKQKRTNFEIHNLVFASDFKTDLIKPFKVAIALAQVWQAQIHLLYVNTPSHFMETNEVLAVMKRFMHQFKEVSFTPHIYNAYDEERGIHQFAKANKVDLIVLTTSGQTGFRALTHSIAECLINHEQTPVLVVNINA